MKRDPKERFFEKVFFHSNGCWIWLGADYSDYGKFRFEGISWNAHAWAFIHLRKIPVPQSLELGHKCRNPGCVNPWHLKLMTRSENVLDSDKTLPVIRANKVFCINGHPFSNDNTYFYRGGRHCRACNNERSKAYQKRKLLAKGE